MRKVDANKARLHINKKIPQDKFLNNALQLADKRPTRNTKTLPNMYKNKQRFRQTSKTKIMLPTSLVSQGHQLTKTRQVSNHSIGVLLTADYFA